MVTAITAITITITITTNRSSVCKSPNFRHAENQRPYVGLGGVENGHMVGVGWVWVLHTPYS